MASTTIRELLVRIGVDPGNSAKAVASLDSALNDFISVAKVAVGAAVAIGAAVGTIAVSAAGAADGIDKGSKAAAISTDAYQELAFAASQAGTDIDMVTKALGKQTEGLRQLGVGAGPIGESLTGLGLTYEQLAQLSPDQQFRATAEAISQLGSEQAMLSAATRIYGEEMAQRLLPLLMGGAAGLDAMSQQAHDLGLVLSQDGIDVGVKFTDTLDQFLRVLGALRTEIGLALIPSLTELLEQFLEWYQLNGDLIKQRLKDWASDASMAIESLGMGLVALDEIVQRRLGGWAPILAAVASGFAALGSALGLLQVARLGLAIKGLYAFVVAIGSGSFLAGLALFGEVVAVVAVLVGLFAALYLVIDDVFTYIRGGDSVLGRMAERLAGLNSYLQAFARVASYAGEVFDDLMFVAQQYGELVYGIFQQIVLPAIQPVTDALVDLADKGFAYIAKIGESNLMPVLRLIQQLLDSISGGIEGLADTLGIDITTRQEQGAMDVAAATQGSVSEATGIALAAPTISEQTASFAPAAPTNYGQLAAGQKYITIEGSQWTINGAGIDADEARELIREGILQESRMIASALDGAEA